MKRTLILSIALAFLAPIAFVGCGEEAKKDDKAAAAPAAPAKEKEKDKDAK